MFRETPDNGQMSIFEGLMFATDQTKTAVEASMAKMVGDVVYPNIDESKFAPLFSTTASRPNISIRRYVSALTLKRMYNLSDFLLLEFLRCGSLNLQYALHTIQEKKQPLSENSLRRFRRKIEEYKEETGRDLVEEEFQRISHMMAVNMGLLGADPDSADGRKSIIERMDSMQVASRAKAMSRLEILYTTNIIVIRHLLKQGYRSLLPDTLTHYCDGSDRNRVLYDRSRENKEPGTRESRLAATLQETILLRKILEDNFSELVLKELLEYKLLTRVIDDQSVEDGNGGRILRDDKDISPDSVQNPFDADMTYRFKNGRHHGYVMNVSEVIDGKGNGIVTDVQFEPNNVSDSSLAEQHFEQLPDDGPGRVCPADAAYGSDRLDELARQKNASIQVTALTGAEPYDIDADFVLNGEGTAVVSCPCGKEPVSNRYNPKTGQIIAEMPDNCCASCPHKNDCNVYQNKKKTKSSIHITSKMVKRAKQARNFSTEDGKKNARMRNGVEGIMSVMRRKYGIDNIPVFGIKRMRIWIWTSMLSYNLVKYRKYLKQSAAA